MAADALKIFFLKRPLCSSNAILMHVFYKMPCLLGDHQCLLGDHQCLLGDHQCLLGDHSIIVPETSLIGNTIPCLNVLL